MLSRETVIDRHDNLVENRLLDILQDIATNVEIDNFSIRHPLYKPLESPPEAIERLLAMPAELQHKYVSAQLRGFLYGIYYNGSLKEALALDSDTTIDPQMLENNTFLGIDLDFYGRVHDSNTGEGYFDNRWMVVREEEDGSIAVAKGGLTLHIRRDIHLQSAGEEIAIGKEIAVRLPKNLVQNGFYMAVGNAGIHAPTGERSRLVRVYFNVTPDGAVAVMRALTRELNKINLPFTFKVLYNPDDYNRYDSGVLYFDSDYHEIVHPILRSIYRENQHSFLSNIPLFTKELAPGLGLAEEPIHKFTSRESFGMNRCQIIANGLLVVRQKEKESTEDRLASILEQFSLLEVDISCPYLNPKSPDIYLRLSE